LDGSYGDVKRPLRYVLPYGECIIFISMSTSKVKESRGSLVSAIAPPTILWLNVGIAKAIYRGTIHHVR